LLGEALERRRGRGAKIALEDLDAEGRERFPWKRLIALSLHGISTFLGAARLHGGWKESGDERPLDGTLVTESG